MGGGGGGLLRLCIFRMKRGFGDAECVGDGVGERMGRGLYD